MLYETKPLPFDPKSISGISEKVLVSHYENNYGGAVKRLNAISAQLAELDFAKAPNFVINGLKREELIAANSMILRDILRRSRRREQAWRRARRSDRTRLRQHRSVADGVRSRWARRREEVRGG
ncbi:hypothetical protein ACVWY3_003191 [Bradyrhizobium sp. USDA 4486]